MLRFAVVLSVSLSATANAAALPCASLVKKFGDVSIRDYKTSASLFALSVENNGEKFELLPNERAVDVIVDGDYVYSIGKNSIEKWSLASKKSIQLWKLPSSTRVYDQPYAAVKLGRNIYIAHGRSGLVVFDTNAGIITYKSTLVSDNGLLESAARGIVVQGDLVFVAIDNYSITKPTVKPAFAGIVAFDPKSFRVVKQLKGFDPGVTSLASDGTSLFASFGGSPIWQYSTDQILAQNDTLPEPTIRIWSYPEAGHPAGHASYDGDKLSTCFAYRDPDFTLYQRKYSEFSYTDLGFQ